MHDLPEPTWWDDVRWRISRLWRDLPWVKGGSTRTVFLIGGYVFKVPTCRYGWEYFLRGLLANMQERQWWRDAQRLPHVDPNHRLCPVVFSLPGGWLVVMKRAYVPPNYRKKFTDMEMKRLEPLFDGLPYDATIQNFGFLGRHLVMIDYGS